MENNSKEIQEEAERKNEFRRVIERIRNMPKRDEAGTSSSDNRQLSGRSRELETERDQIETMSSDSDQTKLQRYFGTV